MSTPRPSHCADLSSVYIDASTLNGVHVPYSGYYGINVAAFLSKLHDITGIDLLSLYSQHVTEQQAEAQVEEMKEGGDVFSSTVTLEDGSLFGRRMALEELFQLFMGRVKEEGGVKGMGQVSIDIMGCR